MNTYEKTVKAVKGAGGELFSKRWALRINAGLLAVAVIGMSAAAFKTGESYGAGQTHEEVVSYLSNEASRLEDMATNYEARSHDADSQGWQRQDAAKMSEALGKTSISYRTITGKIAAREYELE